MLALVGRGLAQPLQLRAPSPAAAAENAPAAALFGVSRSLGHRRAVLPRAARGYLGFPIESDLPGSAAQGALDQLACGAVEVRRQIWLRTKPVCHKVEDVWYELSELPWRLLRALVFTLARWSASRNTGIALVPDFICSLIDLVQFQQAVKAQLRRLKRALRDVRDQRERHEADTRLAAAQLRALLVALLLQEGEEGLQRAKDRRRRTDADDSLMCVWIDGFGAGVPLTGREAAAAAMEIVMCLQVQETVLGKLQQADAEMDRYYAHVEVWHDGLIAAMTEVMNLARRSVRESTSPAELRLLMAEGLEEIMATQILEARVAVRLANRSGTHAEELLRSAVAEFDLSLDV